MTYKQLHAKYLKDADRLSKKGDRVQASEKYWGAAAVLLKFIGKERGLPHHHHRDLQIIINRLYDQTKDRDLFVYFDMAQALHANFYEDFLRGVSFRIHVEGAKELIARLQKLNGKK
ncbi:MAG: PaREP1 family protein [Nitrospirae bacterium]|nr:PaREP1 family protein [Nitrospirota bacterium]